MGADDSARLLGEDDEASAGAGEKDAQTSNPFAIIAFTWRGRFSAIMFVGLCLNYALRGAWIVALCSAQVLRHKPDTFAP